MKNDKLITWLEAIIEFSLCALIFTLPFSKSLVEIFFSLAAACWALKRWLDYSRQPALIHHGLKERAVILLKAFKPVRSELNLPIYALIAVGFLSTLTSVSLPLSLEGFFFKMFEWVMIYFIIVETINTKERLNRILIVLLSSIVLMAIDGIFQFIKGVDFIRHYPIHVDRLRASFDGPNGFAAWLVVMIPVALSLAYLRNGGWFHLSGRHDWHKIIMKTMLWLLSGLLIVCLFLTYTRGAWLAALLAIIFLGIKRSKKLLICTLIVLLALPFIVQEPMKKRVISVLSPADREGTRNQRIKLWQEAIAIIKDFPLIGAGPNTYTAVIPAYTKTTYTGFYPHNSYLHMAAEVGILGLGAFLWIIVKLFKTSSANLKKINNGLYSAILVGLLAGLLGFLVHSFVDVHFYSLQLGNLMWFVMGLIIATQRIALEAEGGL